MKHALFGLLVAVGLSGATVSAHHSFAAEFDDTKPVKVTGTITKVDKGTQTVVVKTTDGTEKTFEYTGNAAADMGKAVGAGTEKGAKVTVYYTEQTGKKIAHFFEM